MTTAIIGIGKIGGAVARHLVAGGESVVLAATDQSHVEALAGELGPLARAGSVVAALLPAGAHYVKAFGTLGADALAAGAHREPQRAVLFYATDDDTAAATIEHLVRAAGFDPLKAGGVADAGRIEVPGGDLFQFGLNGQLADLDQARAMLGQV